MSAIPWRKTLKSIKKRLLVSILAVIFLSTIASAGMTYFQLKAEMDELFDENMKQIAHAIAVHDLTAQSEFISESKDIRRTLKGEEEFLIQVWDQNRLSFSSLSSIEFPRQGPGGIQTVIFDNEEWRYYGLKTHGSWLIQIAQPIPMRHTVIWEIYFEQLVPTLIQLPILAGLIWFVIGFGFGPLKRISFSIEQRSAKFLQKLPEKNVPKEVFTLVKALNGLLDRLSVALESQRHFTADAAHELRTPLTVVRLELDILKQADSREERDQSIEKLYKAVDRSTRLVHQLLEMTRLEPEQIQEVPKPTTLKQLVETVIDEIAPLADKKSITLYLTNFENVSIEGRFHALSTMIGNLLSNAVEYTQEGGRIEISARSETARVIFKIADNGPGIPENERARIFDRFYRILDPAQSGVPGSGLGLSIVKSIVDAHGAIIHVSEGLDGRGAGFEIHFPKSPAI